LEQAHKRGDFKISGFEMSPKECLMPWRLIGFIIICGIFLAFIGFNLENRCTISFGFTEIRDRPVYLIAFASFVLGMFCAIPFIISFRRKKGKDRVPNGEPAPVSKKGGKAKASPVPGGDGGYGDGGSYGID
jgi:uncharacterized integral membrane protein